ncbi:hypothetical protein EJB05_37822, partial [Eragrostis curvula]
MGDSQASGAGDRRRSWSSSQEQSDEEESSGKRPRVHKKEVEEDPGEWWSTELGRPVEIGKDFVPDTQDGGGDEFVFFPISTTRVDVFDAVKRSQKIIQDLRRRFPPLPSLVKMYAEFKRTSKPRPIKYLEASRDGDDDKHSTPAKDLEDSQYDDDDKHSTPAKDLEDSYKYDDDDKHSTPAKDLEDSQYDDDDKHSTPAKDLEGSKYDDDDKHSTPTKYWEDSQYEDDDDELLLDEDSQLCSNTWSGSMFKSMAPYGPPPAAAPSAPPAAMSSYGPPSPPASAAAAAGLSSNGPPSPSSAGLFRSPRRPPPACTSAAAPAGTSSSPGGLLRSNAMACASDEESEK